MSNFLVSHLKHQGKCKSGAYVVSYGEVWGHAERWLLSAPWLPQGVLPGWDTFLCTVAFPSFYPIPAIRSAGQDFQLLLKKPSGRQQNSQKLNSSN